MNNAVDSGTESELVDMAENAVVQAKVLYHVLVQILKGKARVIARQAERNNGFALWVKFKKEYEPDVRGRFPSMLMGVLNPKSWTRWTSSISGLR